MSSGHDVDTAATWAAGLDLATHEIVERRMVAQYVRKGDLVLEGGAGIGAVTRVMLDAGATVVAFEPGPEQWEWLTRLYDAYPSGQLTPRHAALAVESGRIPLHVYQPWYATRIGHLGGAVPSHTISAEARSWDEELFCRPYTGLVLDIEGTEHDLLRADFPPSLDWIVAELHGEPAQMAATLLAPKGFKLDAIAAHFTYLVVAWKRTGVSQHPDGVGL